MPISANNLLQWQVFGNLLAANRSGWADCALFMIIAATTQWRHHKSGWLVWMSAPVLALMIIQSYLSRSQCKLGDDSLSGFDHFAGWLAC